MSRVNFLQLVLPAHIRTILHLHALSLAHRCARRCAASKDASEDAAWGGVTFEAIEEGALHLTFLFCGDKFLSRTLSKSALEAWHRRVLSCIEACVGVGGRTAHLEFKGLSLFPPGKNNLVGVVIHRYMHAVCRRKPQSEFAVAAIGIGQFFACSSGGWLGPVIPCRFHPREPMHHQAVALFEASPALHELHRRLMALLPAEVQARHHSGPWVPHLTLGKFRGPTAKVAAAARHILRPVERGVRASAQDKHVVIE